MGSTMANESQIAEVILRTLAELNRVGALDLDGLEPDGNTQLFGEYGLLDSVGLVSLIVEVEEALADELGVEVALADERSLSQRSSPYQTVGSLAAYAATRVADD
jgi:D-alanine--poly(phosphoribitol) ligase subunit 2